MNYKACLKAIVPFVGTVVAVLVQVAATGEFDQAAMATAITGILASVVVYLVPNQPSAKGSPSSDPVNPLNRNTTK